MKKALTFIKEHDTIRNRAIVGVAGAAIIGGTAFIVKKVRERRQ